MSEQIYKIQQKTSDTEVITIYPRTSADVVNESLDKKWFTQTLKNKLASINENAQANVIEGIILNGNVIAPANKTITLNKLVELVSGKIPSSLLGNYVDEVIEGYYYNSEFYSDSAHTQKITNTQNKLYVDLSNTKYKIYRGALTSNGTATYIEISQTLSIGTSGTTAYSYANGVANLTKINNLFNTLAELKAANTTISNTHTSIQTLYANIINGIQSIDYATYGKQLSSSVNFIFKGIFSGSNSITLQEGKSYTFPLQLESHNAFTASTATGDVHTVDKYGRVTHYENEVFKYFGSGTETTPNSNLAVNGLFFNQSDYQLSTPIITSMLRDNKYSMSIKNNNNVTVTLTGSYKQGGAIITINQTLKAGESFSESLATALEGVTAYTNIQATFSRTGFPTVSATKQ